MRSPGLALLLAAAVALAGIGVVLLAAQADTGRPRAPAATTRANVPEPPRLERFTSADDRRPSHPRPDRHEIHWRDSVAVGLPEAGSLKRGVRLPPGGAHFFTWDPIHHRSPSPGWRRWGTDELVRTTLRVVREYRAAHPRAPRVAIGDLSRPHGGYFGPEVSGGLGHATHQNGLDVDIYYPRLDRAERSPLDATEIDRDLSQDLVDRFLAMGAVTIYVGPNTDLTGPAGVVVPLVNHDNHLHVRIPG
jgi:Penicillin-insensitive murein endopeptidase